MSFFIISVSVGGIEYIYFPIWNKVKKILPLFYFHLLVFSTVLINARHKIDLCFEGEPVWKEIGKAGKQSEFEW